MRPLLSILIPTVVGREAHLDRLLNEIAKQATALSLNGEVKAIFLKDDKSVTIGAKRQQLYSMSEGKYSTQIDDDDMIAPDYLKKVLKAIESHPDCVCYFEHVNFMGQTKVSCHSNDFDDWGERYHDGDQYYDYIRTPYFKDVIKTDICKQIPVPDIRYAEDIEWSRRLKKSGLIKTEVFINDYMYFYEYRGHMTQQQMKERYGIK